MQNNDLIQDYEISGNKKSFSYKVKRMILNFFLLLSQFFSKGIKSLGTRRFNHKLLDKRIPKAYKKAAKQPIDENKIVFVEIRLPSLTNSFQVVFDELLNNYDYTIHTHFLLNNSVLRDEYAKRVINAVEDIATAKYVFLDEGSNAISAIPLRPETKVIQLWHGCGAFKKFGFSTADLIFGAGRKEQLRHPFNKNYSLVTVSSPEVIWAYKEAMHLPEDSDIVQATGSSRTDVFYDEEFINDAYRHVYEIIPQAKDKKIILYAPTFRGRVARATTPEMLNIKMFYEAFGDEYILLFKHHPIVKMPPPIPEAYKDFAMDVGSILSIEELLCVSDICISDYSSLVFEYSLFEKPLIFFAYDLDEYFDWRGFYYDYFELAPGLIAKTNFEMIDYIKHIDERFDKKAIQDFRYKFMRSCDGHATQRILEYAFDDLEKHKKPCDNFEHFYTVPKVEPSKAPYFKRVEAIRKTKEKASLAYKAAANAPIEDIVVALDVKASECKWALKKFGNDIKYISSKKPIEEIIGVIAKAKSIIIDEPNTLLDSIELREDTKVYLIPKDAFPLVKFGIASKEYRSGLFKEQYELAPYCKSVTHLVAPSQETFDIMKSAFAQELEPVIIGDIRSDAFNDDEFKQNILEKLFARAEAAFAAENPGRTFKMRETFEGKKIVSFFAESDTQLDDSTIYEYICRDYIFLKHFDRVNTNLPATTLIYYCDKIIDVSKYLTKYETLAISDIVISGFDSSAFSFMASSKPLILYSSNPNKDILNTEGFVDIKSVCPTSVCTNMTEVASAIENIENYDYSKYNEIKAKYLTECDGQSTKRLIDILK